MQIKTDSSSTEQWDELSARLVESLLVSIESRVSEYEEEGRKMHERHHPFFILSSASFSSIVVFPALRQ